MAQETKNTKLVTVYYAQGMLRAMVVRGALESAGIPVVMRYESVGPVIGLTIDGIGRVEVRVPEEWEVEARDLLNAEPRSGEIYSVLPNDDVRVDDELESSPSETREGGSARKRVNE